MQRADWRARARSEEEQLTFLSVFNQSASIVMNMFRFQSVQVRPGPAQGALAWLPCARGPQQGEQRRFQQPSMSAFCTR
jgi:hypothetical protein